MSVLKIWAVDILRSYLIKLFEVFEKGVVLKGINDRFIEDLQHGELAFFLEQVKTRRNLLSLQVRDGYINIYY